jgi:hypothetical protein
MSQPESVQIVHHKAEGKERANQHGKGEPNARGCQKSVPGVQRRCDQQAMVRRRVLSSC